MTPKQILDSFSETLIQDERILSAQERDLLTTLLQHVRSAANQNHEIQEAVRKIISSAVGETVAQRAFSVLGSSIVERIVENGGQLQRAAGAVQTPEMFGDPQPQPPFSNPPSPQPQPPHTPPKKPAVMGNPPPQPPSTDPSLPQPQPPHTPERPLPESPMLPNPQPQPPHAQADRKSVAQSALAVLDKPSHLPARCVVLDEFLAPQEVQELIRFTLDHESEFSASEVVSPVVESGVVNYEHRRSRVLMNLGRYQDLIIDRIRTVMPQVLQELSMEEFNIADLEVQITASNDGDFFRFHSDNGSDRVASRRLTFVYFFHREPMGFEGGELRIHDARLQDHKYVSEGSYQAINPQQNQIVFFPCELLHEITPVKCASQLFADSRFTLNGWLRK